MRSHAKLNWYLRILNKRDDGYHDLETVFHELELHDELLFERSPEDSCHIEGFPSDVPADINLIARAWQLMRNAFPGKIGGINVSARKSLPRGGGLGGGSSNAAVAIREIDRLYLPSSSSDQLSAIGAQLGSDVPFFLKGGCAVGLGRGEIIRNWMASPPCFHLVLVFPSHGISTADAYRRLSAVPRPAPSAQMDEVLAGICSGKAEMLAPLIHNDFEVILRSDRADGRTWSADTWFSDCQLVLDRAGALRTFLCGSGSTVAALGKDLHHVAAIASAVSDQIPYPVEITSTRAVPERPPAR